MLRMRQAAVFLFAVLAWSDTYPRQSAIDVEHYVFRLTLTDESDEIAGEATVTVRFRQAGATALTLDLASPLKGKGMTVSTVTGPGGTALTYSHESDKLVISITPAPAAGDRRDVNIKYRGIPASGLRIDKNKHGERTFFGLNWPNLARQWLPMIDHPYEKATSEFLVTAPAHYQVVANGLLIEERDLGGGKRLTHWKQSVPISSWLNAIGVAQFSVRHVGHVRGTPLETWVYHQDAASGAGTFEVPSRQAMEFFSDRIGPYPYEKLANVQAAGLSGGTEHASAIFYGEASVNGKPATNLVIHEIAHQWFGDAITEKDWDDVWLSEGFATYFTLLANEHYDGRDAFVAGLGRAKQAVAEAQKKAPDQPIIHRNLGEMSKVLNRLVYQKGAWVLHMLRGEMGTERFWAGIRDYYARYRDRNVSTDDFRAVMEQHHGRNLQWFFDQWLRRPGWPTVEGGWHYDGASKKLVVELEQKQTAEVYRLPLELAIGSGEARRIERLEMTEKRQRFEFTVEKAPGPSVMLDPNVWMLMDARFEAR